MPTVLTIAFWLMLSFTVCHYTVSLFVRNNFARVASAVGFALLFVIFSGEVTL
jgi:hypothetical protein